jgi:hypothetical protein
MPPGTISYTVKYNDFYPRPFMVAKFNLKHVRKTFLLCFEGLKKVNVKRYNNFCHKFDLLYYYCSLSHFYCKLQKTKVCLGKHCVRKYLV